MLERMYSFVAKPLHQYGDMLYLKLYCHLIQASSNEVAYTFILLLLHRNKFANGEWLFNVGTKKYADF